MGRSDQTLVLMPEQLWFTEILNHLFAGPVTALLRMLHIEPKYPQAPIPNSFAMELLVFVFLLILFLLVRSRLSVESPGGLAALVRRRRRIRAGPEPRNHRPSQRTLHAFFCHRLHLHPDLQSDRLIPGFESPTGVPIVPLGCAICAFLYYHAQGFKHAGPKYLLHFFGPPMEGMPLIARILLAALMLPIELVSHFARLLSLTVRLWANIFAGDLITLVFFSMIPIGVPIIFCGLHIVVAFLQAYVFMLLSIIYVSGAVAEEH